MEDMVNHPKHYTYGKIEVIDIIESVVDGMKLVGAEAVLTGNVLKYICRWKVKGNPVENLKKAKWYLDRLIAKNENKKEINFIKDEN